VRSVAKPTIVSLGRRTYAGPVWPYSFCNVFNNLLPYIIQEHYENSTTYKLDAKTPQSASPSRTVGPPPLLQIPGRHHQQRTSLTPYLTEQQRHKALVTYLRRFTLTIIIHLD